MGSKSLTALVSEFLIYKRSNGYIYIQGEYHLNKYVAFSATKCPDVVIPSKESVESFLDKYVSAPGSLYNAASVIREFGKYLIARGYADTYVIPAKRVKLPTPVQPYFFTSSEIVSFFEACDSIKNDPHVKGRHLVLPAIYRLLYCCGLRCKEVRTLRRDDVHHERRYLDILQSKGPKSRRIFIPEDLAAYLKEYDQKIGSLFPGRQTFFPNRKDMPYGAQMLERNFYRIWFRAFPAKENSDISIRPYDFRHHFVYANMNRWLLEGRDAAAMLPYLMRYMGHSDVKNTLYYSIWFRISTVLLPRNPSHLNHLFRRWNAMAKKSGPKNKDGTFFWETAGKFLNHELPNVRKKSPNTVSSYRHSLNIYIDYLEEVRGMHRCKICFEDMNKNNLKEYLLWMDIRWNAKTCNLRLTAIRSLLSFASEESMDVTPLYVAYRTIRGLKTPVMEIEYFEDYQLAAILAAPRTDKKTEWRNRMMLILGYDTAVRVGELVSLTVGNLHLDADVPYVSIFGKGSKYRNVPLMSKTILHLNEYLGEFHPDMNSLSPLFYAATHGRLHALSDDTVQKMLKKYAEQCRGNIHMPENIHFHMLRKTRAMNLYQAGCPLPHIQQMLGHENISTTSGFYAFATLHTLAEALEKVSPLAGSEEKIWKKKEILKKLYRL